MKKISWDTILEPSLLSCLGKWELSLLPFGDRVPRSFVKFCEPITEIELHAFGDASCVSVRAAADAVVRQVSSLNTQLVAGKVILLKMTSPFPSLNWWVNVFHSQLILSLFLPQTSLPPLGDHYLLEVRLLMIDVYFVVFY